MSTYIFPSEEIHEFLIPKYPNQEDYISDKLDLSQTLYEILEAMEADIASIGSGSGYEFSIPDPSGGDNPFTAFKTGLKA